MDFLIIAIVVLNICFAISIVFFERKTPEIALAWLTVLVFIPVLGFLLYIVFGRNFYRTRLFKIKAEDEKKVQDQVASQLKDVTRIEEQEDNERYNRFLRVIRMLLVSNNAIVTRDNTIEIYTNGIDKFKALFAAIEKATEFIHVQYFYIAPDGMGTELAALLTRKAQEGVEVKVLVDGLHHGLPVILAAPQGCRGETGDLFPGFFTVHQCQV
jgi:cardiolipin synthase